MASPVGQKKSGAFGAVGGGGRKEKRRGEGRKRKRWAGADSDLRRCEARLRALKVSREPPSPLVPFPISLCRHALGAITEEI
jgi:hypothetical protein